MNDADFRRRAHEVIRRLVRGPYRPGCATTIDETSEGETEIEAVLAAGPGSADPDAPVTLCSYESDPRETSRPPPSQGNVMIRPSLIVAAVVHALPHSGQFVHLRLRGPAHLYIRREMYYQPSADGGLGNAGILSSSPCRAIPDPWRNV